MEVIGDATLYLGDCEEILPDIGFVDAVVTDPPYPDYLVDLYGEADINFINQFECRKFIFWSAKSDFPLNYSAIHIWDKKTGCGSEYERIFEINGNKQYKVFRYYLINSEVSAKYTNDVWTGHPSQKPIKLIEKIILMFDKSINIIFDPYMGSGTTGVASINLGKKFIGIEREQKYFDIACKRIEQAERQGDLFMQKNNHEQLNLNLK